MNFDRSHGFRWQSEKGWFFLSIAGNIYLFHLSLGPFSVCWDALRSKR